MKQMNIIKCKICGSSLISEEIDDHVCFEYDNLLFDTAGFVSFDGGRKWISDEFLHRDKRGRNPTETGQSPEKVQLG